MFAKRVSHGLIVGAFIRSFTHSHFPPHIISQIETERLHIASPPLPKPVTAPGPNGRTTPPVYTLEIVYTRKSNGGKSLLRSAKETVTLGHLGECKAKAEERRAGRPRKATDEQHLRVPASFPSPSPFVSHLPRDLSITLPCALKPDRRVVHGRRRIRRKDLRRASRGRSRKGVWTIDNPIARSLHFYLSSVGPRPSTWLNWARMYPSFYRQAGRQGSRWG